MKHYLRVHVSEENLKALESGKPFEAWCGAKLESSDLRAKLDYEVMVSGWNFETDGTEGLRVIKFRPPGNTSESPKSTASEDDQEDGG